MKSIYNLL